MRAAFLSSLAGLAIGVASCSNSETGERIVIDDLPEASEDASGVWESQPWSSEAWIEYPGSATLVITHALGRTPRVVLVYLSFAENGEAAALAAGDLATLVDADDETVTLENRTKSDFFARVVLE